MSSTQVKTLFRQINAINQIARCLQISSPQFYYVQNYEFDKEKYKEDVNKLISFYHHPMIASIRQVHPSNKT